MLLFQNLCTKTQAETPNTTTKTPFSEDQRAALEDFVRNFILDNPEVLMESVNRFRTAEEKKKEEGSVTVLKDNMVGGYNTVVQ